MFKSANLWFLGLTIVSSIASAQVQSTMPWEDSNFGCINETAARKYTRDFNIDTRSFGGMELCRHEVDTKKLFNDLLILELGTFQQEGKNVFIRGFVPAGQYYSWMKSQTRGMNRGQDIPYATAYNRGGYFTMQDGWALLSTLGRVGTVVHEARHTANYRHYSCDQGPYQGAGVSGCDPSYQFGGSHAVEMEYYARVSIYGTNFHPVYKTMARLMAIARSNAFFNQPVIQKREAVLALSVDRSQAELAMGQRKVIREAPQVEGVLKRTSFGGALFTGQGALAIELYGSQKLGVPVEDTYSYYKLLLEKRLPLVDFEEFDIGTQRYVLRMQNKRSLEFFNFPQGEWHRPLALNFEVALTSTQAPNGQTGIFLVGKDTKVYPLDPRSRTVGQPLNVTWDPNVVSLASWEGYQLKLKTDGIIYVSNGQQEQVWPGAQGRYKGLVNVPVYDGFDVSSR
jgi:hypothetical protein